MLEQINLFEEKLNFKNFLNGKEKAKKVFEIIKIEKLEAYDFVKKYHYLSEAKFFSKFSYGLCHKGQIVGVATYSNPQGISSLKGWFSIGNEDQSILELSRLCLLPELNGSNASSFLLGGSIKKLKKEGVRAVITLADSSRHVGSIYQICNFKYYGLTDKKTDFYSEKGLNPRGKTKNLQGVWLPRTRKHRYCFLLDKNLKPNYKEVERPKKQTQKNICCNGEGVVFDSRFRKTYACPRCNDFKLNGLLNIYDLPDFV